ncbi:hypothetical protein A2943_00255 [Candidatus Adlerbacteria bacterium RIFCSPLOWO2_01_FULL_51_16]|uniref:Uncharacterized protein n=1 Tax=Candidatus Adlerbacteria bacterium RIFCSPLOWO2_01_FULL_51_16 TaxID=1797243 RepID=A0A1F4XGJ7_9BACT|nr:MAG: hypothetical protein A2943_00255 [Candidatus Adlerbacteria bacterium RIFCSPLOWO2_01_FULL_51_16]
MTQDEFATAGLHQQAPGIDFLSMWFSVTTSNTEQLWRLWFAAANPLFYMPPPFWWLHKIE